MLLVCSPCSFLRCSVTCLSSFCHRTTVGVYWWEKMVGARRNRADDADVDKLPDEYTRRTDDRPVETPLVRFVAHLYDILTSRCLRICCRASMFVWTCSYTTSLSSSSSSSSSTYLDKTKHKCQGHVGTYRHHSNIHDRVVLAVQWEFINIKKTKDI